ncbi:MAG: DUF58 domain-containing protein [Sulfurifustaceae bacterium]
MTTERHFLRLRPVALALDAASAGIRLERRLLYILPTREGLYYAAMLVIMLLAAINYANGLAYVLTFLLGSIGIVAILQTHRNVSGVRVAPGSAAPVFAGQPAIFGVVFENRSALPRYAIDVDVGGHVQRIDLPARATVTLQIPVPTTKRGYAHAPPLNVRTRFPLGLWRAWSRALALPTRCLVYPRPGLLRPFPPQPGLEGAGEHGYGAEGDDFAGLREFRPGDPVQRVAWKKAAAGQGWYTKQFTSAAGHVVWFDWDALKGTAHEERLSTLCRWVLAAEQQGLSYGLRLPGTSFAPAIGPIHRDRCLEALALFPEAP